MTAPVAKPNRIEGPGGETPPAPSAFPTLKKRKEFLAAARARKWASGSMIVQARRRRPEEHATGVRVGFTCSKKVGGAVLRNRAKRRLRAAAADTLPRLGRDGWDYVLIGKSGSTIARPFSALISDLEFSLERLHAPQKPGKQAKQK